MFHNISMATNLGKDESTTPETPKENAAILLNKFLTDSGIELRLTPMLVRQVEGGAVQIEQPQIVAEFKAVNSIKSN